MNRLDSKLLTTGLLALVPTLGCQSIGESWSGMSTGVKSTVAGAGTAALGGLGAKALGADTDDALLIGGAAGLLAAGATYLYYDSRDASEEERQHASRKAEDARVRLQEEQIRELERENAILAVRVDDLESREAASDAAPDETMEVMYVDPSTGEPVDGKVHTIEHADAGSGGRIDDQAVVFLG